MPGRGGPIPEWRPRFSGKRVRQCRQLINQRGACHMEVQRARLALLLYRHSEMSSPEAARRLGQSPQWVYQWRRCWVEDGFSLTERARRGRPRCTRR